MNNDQFKHIATALNTIAIGHFVVFGYTRVISQPVQWLQIGLSSLGFLNIEFLALWVLSFIRNEEE
jgi:hypothetical protein